MSCIVCSWRWKVCNKYPATMNISLAISSANVDVVSEVLENVCLSSGKSAVFTRRIYTQISHAYVQRENATLSTAKLDVGDRNNPCYFQRQLDINTDDRRIRVHCVPSPWKFQISCNIKGACAYSILWELKWEQLGTICREEQLNVGNARFYLVSWIRST
jgi:hypothetical protein